MPVATSVTMCVSDDTGHDDDELLMMNKMMAIKMVVAMTLVMVMIKDELVLMIGLLMSMF